MPQKINWTREIKGHHWPQEHPEILHLKVIMDNVSTGGMVCVVILKDETRSVQLHKWHNDRLHDVMLLQPSHILAWLVY